MTPGRAIGHGERARAPDPGTRRVFFALWPDDAVRSALSAAASALRGECGGREMRAPNIHLTLIFIGNVAPERLRALEDVAGRVSASRFDLAIDTLNYWRHNRIAWAGASEVPRALADLFVRLAEPLRAAGFRFDDRPYVPHVTLVRDARRAPAERTVGPVLWPASEFVLAESVRRDGRSAYEVLRRWPLAD